jgi:hypothetical protein
MMRSSHANGLYNFYVCHSVQYLHIRPNSEANSYSASQEIPRIY